MPRYVVKPKPDEDFYIIYSTVVDAPAFWGDHKRVLDELAFQRGVPPATDSMARADDTGSSAMWAEAKWGDEGFIVREGWSEDAIPDGAWHGTVKRTDLRELCETATKRGEFRPRKGLRERITWYYPEEDE